MGTQQQEQHKLYNTDNKNITNIQGVKNKFDTTF